MKSVCFIIDTCVTGAQLPRHLHAIYHAAADHPAYSLQVTSLNHDNRLSLIEQRFAAHCIVSPATTLGARLNHAAAASQAEWLIFALHATALPATLWRALFPMLDSYAVEAVVLGASEPTLPARLLQRFLATTLQSPPYIAVRRTWLERLGGFDPELDRSAIHDFLQRLHACPTRIHTFTSQAPIPPTGHIA
ncbi:MULTISPECIES: hypothetical protein [unclassified Halomonas]|uniref:hypothetical protein n=1 Tax=unclassified Halomonas TaxID=2609666 RepID=UPI0006D9983F|nr:MULTISPECIES: hypothetical protein [unclassified Halomonas]KPQ22115.1 MAG: hypothetical protein HLUCCO06_09875 [Halomonas sp. HL-93]SBR52082.1 hypothetical protein GA0071314_3529 [Halomonas sp. HL-93]SNY98181.1 hypothetical protein SAMN04488142_2800 [Halomonas sp. hl-4]